eukprot:SAG11_NODE_30_length_23132_cov_22.413277_2_plen_142_part_00
MRMLLATCVACLVLSVTATELTEHSSGCNPERFAELEPHTTFADGRGRPITRDPGFPKSPTPKILLPQIKGDESPAALDGSPMALYFSPSTSGSTKWTISIDGGGFEPFQHCLLIHSTLHGLQLPGTNPPCPPRREAGYMY